MPLPAEDLPVDGHQDLERLEHEYAFALGFFQNIGAAIPKPVPDAGHSHCVMHSGAWLNGTLYVAEISGRIIKWTIGEDIQIFYHPELKFASSLAWNPLRQTFLCVVAPPCGQHERARLFELDRHGSLRPIKNVVADLAFPHGALFHDGDMYLCDALASKIQVLGGDIYEKKETVDTKGLTPITLRSGFGSVYMLNCKEGYGVVGRNSGEHRQSLVKVDFETGELIECLAFYEQYVVCDFVFSDDALYILTESRGRWHYIHKYDAMFKSLYRVNLTALLDRHKTQFWSMTAAPGRLFVNGYGQTPFWVELLITKEAVSFGPATGDIWNQG